MKLKMLVLVVMMVMGCSALFAGMMPAAEEMKAFDAIVDKAMTAYNDGDSKAFYADFAVMMAAICTPEAFKNLYVDSYMKIFGKYVSRTVIEAETVVIPDVPNGFLVYEAKFERTKKLSSP
ncbi:hypothetical protein MASR1M12_37620 [Erysipelotrichia bacterium]